MRHITYADGIAIFQILYYTPALLGNMFVAGRHGVMKTSGWIFLTIFCIVRLVGASARLATITHPHSDGAYATSLLCSILGLSPLLMASLGMVSRAYYSMLQQPGNTIFSFYIVKIVHTPAIVALILCIIGATNAASPADIASQSTVHVGVILYVIVLVMLIILTFIAYLLKRRTDKGEATLILAVSCAILYIFVRLLYSLLSTFSHLGAFNPVTGSETALLFMSVMQEMAAVVIYIAAGLKLPAVPHDVAGTPGQRLAHRAGRGGFGAGKLGIISLGPAVLNAFSTPRGDERVKDVERKECGSQARRHRR